MKKNIILLLTLLVSNLLYSQIIFEFPAITTPSVDDEPIELKKLIISVYVVENIATTTLEMQFFNANNRVMEGELNFPLANGITVSRFALDVNSEMREGVVVEKEKATQAFEAVTRKKVDPGIVEVTKGNNFKARVYPIPAKGYKKAIIAFEQELSGNDDNFIYQLPLNIKHSLDEFYTIVEVVMNKPEAIRDKKSSINLKFKDVRNSYISEYHKNNIQLETQLVFAIPRPKKISKVLTYKGSVSSDNYFYININPIVEKRQKIKPSNIAIVWDESASSKNRNIDKELSILKNYLNWIQDATIELLTFSNTVHIQEIFTIKAGNCDDLIKRLEDSNFDGATNIGSIDFSALKADEILLFTDGISNFGKEPKIDSSSPIMSINTSNITNHNLLEYIANSSKGLYVNATAMDVNEALMIISTQQKRFISAEYDQQNIKEFYPEYGQAIFHSFSCAGKAEGAINKVKLNFGFGDEITEIHEVKVDNTNRITNSIGERIWAQKKLKSLLDNAKDDEIKAHGKKYSLVTPRTSLIVLDDVSDYVKYEIMPPESLQEDYNKLMSEKSKTAIQSSEQRLEQICKQFETDIKWWKEIGDHRELVSISTQGDTIPPPPPPAPQTLETLNTVEGDAELEEIQFDRTSTEANEDMGLNLAEIVVARSDNNEHQATSSAFTSSMSINKWESNAEYLSDLKAVDSEKLYDKYLELREDHLENPSFYFDVASYMFQKSQRGAGLRVISNLAELETENHEILRVLGRKLSEHKFYNEAIYIFNRIATIRSFEPHSFIDLGITYAEKGEYQKALDNLYTVIDKNWDSDILSRFSGIENIILHDINNIIFHHHKELDFSKIEACLVKHLPVDIRVIIDWDANETDIDLWTTDPQGEKCSYNNKKTKIGGKISNDITQGYGPEEFRLKHAVEGKYLIEVNFYGTRKQTTLGNVTVRAFVYTNFGSINEHKEMLTLQLEPNKKGHYTIGEMKFER